MFDPDWNVRQFEFIMFTRPRFTGLIEADDYRFGAAKHIFYELGNGICFQKYNTEDCCYDGGDCIPRFHCASCKIDMRRNYADGVCDEGYNTRECCFDGGDCGKAVCLSCPSNDRPLVGDGTCQQDLNTAQCCFDAGDCGGESVNCPYPDRINDLVCDQELQTEICNFDGDDCKSVIAGLCPTCMAENSFRRMKDGNCDHDLNTLHCCFDGGDCHDLTECPTCQSFVEVIESILW